jgi:hypothetical protein
MMAIRQKQKGPNAPSHVYEYGTSPKEGQWGGKSGWFMCIAAMEKAGFGNGTHEPSVVVVMVDGAGAVVVRCLWCGGGGWVQDIGIHLCEIEK